ncbi:MAG TPA: adhesin [Clostridiaceae bacterium]|nr:adhesin [Clostridiaceae bacterium]
MKITDKAKSIITEVMQENSCDCLMAKLQQSCCGTSLYFTLIKLGKGDKPATINGIPVVMDDKTAKRAETVTLAEENGKVIIQDDAPSCCC